MTNNLIVMKFGGTSVGNAECIKRTAEIIASYAAKGPTVAVVSAMSGVTNRLVAAAQRATTGDESICGELSSSLREQHLEAINALINDKNRREQLIAETETIINDVTNLCRGTALLRELTPRALDAISSTGERLSARLVAGAVAELKLESIPVEATELIVTDNEHGGAEPIMELTRERSNSRLLPLVSDGTVPVVTGFIGATTEGILTTLGRGGSDYSATILGGALDAKEIIIWTDVEGVMTADPRLVPEARTIREISYNEAGELAYFGAKVLHPKTLRPVAEAGVPVWIKNSFQPDLTGTKITPSGKPSSNGVKAITAISNVSLITVGGRGIVDVPGIAARTFTAAASVKANVLLISQSSSQSDICFIVNSVEATKTVDALRQSFALDLAHHQVEHINIDPEIAIVAVVGDRMRGTPGIAGKIFSALGREAVNIIAIAQGSSEFNVSFVVEAAAMKKAMQTIHKEFSLEQISDKE
jgi:bifunctional aspartokinase / homoserine dehydrogenase 1